MVRAYYTGEVAKLLKLSQRHLLRLLKDGTVPEPKLRNSYSYRQWSKADIKRAQQALVEHRKRKA